VRVASLPGIQRIISSRRTFSYVFEVIGVCSKKSRVANSFLVALV
jgi:hypothetical protein